MPSSASTPDRIAALDARWYPDHGDNWDDALFRNEILKVMSADSVALDLGAGAGIVSQMNFRGVAAEVTGLDLDPRVEQNPYLDKGVVGSGDELPFPDSSFDLVFSDNVLEHLDDPKRVFQEVARVLRPGGRFLAKTPNRWHYMPLIATLTPHRLHRAVNRLRGRDEVDTFPTRYRVNSEAAVRRVAGATGFEVESIALVEGRPEYLRLSAPTYWLGRLYERAVNASGLLRHLRILLVIRLRKR